MDKNICNYVIKVKILFLVIYMLNELVFIILDEGIFNFLGSKFEISVFLLFLFYFWLIFF